MKPGKRRLLDRDGAEAAAEKRKASVRAKVEHPFLYVKRRFGYGKVRYRGLAKNTQRIALPPLAHRWPLRDRITRGPCAHGPREGGSRTHRSDFLTVRTVYPARQPTLPPIGLRNRIFEPQPIAFLPKWGCSDLP